MAQDSSGISGEAPAPAATAAQPPRRRRGRPPRARGKPNSSDDATGRWTIRGVPPPVRDMAVRRASERGMTVGDWVAEAIVGFARAADRAAGGSNLPATESPPDIVALIRRLDDRITRLEQRPTLGFFGRLFGRRP